MKNSVSYIESVQPYFELTTENFYKHSVSCEGKYWFYTFSSAKDENSRNVTFLPDGCTNLVIEYNDSVKASMVFNTTEAVSMEMNPNSEYFAIRFTPGENPFVKGDVIKESAGSIISVQSEEISSIVNALKGRFDFEDRMETAIAYLKSIETESPSKKLFKQLLDIIIEKNGLIKISQLEALAGYSSRYINHLFDLNAGMSAKQFCNIIKFQLVLNEINKGHVDSFSKIASDWRFYDQSHFIHEFKSYTGMTPSDYSEALKIAG